MGSRAVVFFAAMSGLAETLWRRGAMLGVCLHTHRPAILQEAVEAQFLARAPRPPSVRTLGELKTDWLCLDCELMPWSAKAQELLRQQYAPGVGGAGSVLLPS